MAEIGHNSATRVAKDQLKAIIERIERLEAEKSETVSDIRDVYAEAKGNGFDTKALRAIVRLRKQDADERREQQEIIDTYMHALGMLSDLPLGQAAVDREFGDTKVTISSPGMEPVETTAGAISRAAAHIKTPAGKRDLRRAVKEATEPTAVDDDSLVMTDPPRIDSSDPPFGAPPP